MIQLPTLLTDKYRHWHSPTALVVEEEDEVEFLFCFVLHLFSNAQHVQGRHGDGDPIVLAAHTWHVGVDDLFAVGEVKRDVTNTHTYKTCKDIAERRLQFTHTCTSTTSLCH